MRALLVSTWTQLCEAFKTINMIISEVLLETTAAGEKQSILVCF